MMNRETRRLSKIPEQVREEVRPFYLDRTVISDVGSDRSIDKLTDETAENIRSGLAVRNLSNFFGSQLKSKSDLASESKSE